MADNIGVDIKEINSLKLELIRAEERERYNSRIVNEKLKSIEDQKKRDDERNALKKEIRVQEEFIDRVTVEMSQLKSYIGKVQDEWKHRIDFEKEFLNAKYKLQVVDVMQRNKQMEADQSFYREELNRASQEALDLGGRIENLEGTVKNAGEEIERLKPFEALAEEFKASLERLNAEKDASIKVFEGRLKELEAESFIRENQFELRIKRAREEAEAKQAEADKDIKLLKSDLSIKRAELEQMENRFSNRERNYIHRIYEINSESEKNLNQVVEKDEKIAVLVGELEKLKGGVEAAKERFEKELLAAKTETKQLDQEYKLQKSKTEALERLVQDTKSALNLKLEEAAKISELELKKKDLLAERLGENVRELEDKLAAGMKELESYKSVVEAESTDRVLAEKKLYQLKTDFVRLDQEYRKIFKKSKILLLFEKPILFGEK